jgi:hypothetical protein
VPVAGGGCEKAELLAVLGAAGLSTALDRRLAELVSLEPFSAV